jgi:hypothetical protein
MVNYFLQEEPMRKLWIVLIIFVAGLAAPQAIFSAHPHASKVEKNTGEEKWYLETPLAIRKAVVVNASVDKAWEAWTTTEGVTTFFALNPHFSQEIYYDAKSTHACCVALPQTPRRTDSTPASASVVRLASTGIFDISLRSLVRNAGYSVSGDSCFR